MVEETVRLVWEVGVAYTIAPKHHMSSWDILDKKTEDVKSIEQLLSHVNWSNGKKVLN